MVPPKNIVVVGGNAAGPAAAAKAKRTAPESNVIMIEAGEFISTGTCELPYVLSGEIRSYQDIIFFTPESFQKEKGVKVYTNHFVEKIDRQKKVVTVKNLLSFQKSEFAYDKLILATGSKCKTLPQLPHSIKNVFYLKTVKDYLSINDFLKKNSVKNVLIIGAGYIGIESAEAFKNLGYNVSLIEKEKLPMPGVDDEVRHLLLEIIRENGVEYIGGISKPKFGLVDDKIDSTTIEGYSKEFDLILLALGFEPNNELAITSKLKIGKFGGIHVDQKMRTSDPNIFAAGDNVEVVNRITGKNDYIPLATYAQQMGHIAGENAAGGISISHPVIKNIAIKVFNKYLVIVGLNEKEAKQNNFGFVAVNSVERNLIKVMPASQNVFGKLLIDKNTKKIIGASFLGGKEVAGYGDLISSFIQNNIKVSELSKIYFNYSPPISPFINLLSVLGRKSQKVLT